MDRHHTNETEDHQADASGLPRRAKHVYGGIMAAEPRSTNWGGPITDGTLASIRIESIVTVPNPGLAEVRVGESHLEEVESRSSEVVA